MYGEICAVYFIVFIYKISSSRYDDHFRLIGKRVGTSYQF